MEEPVAAPEISAGQTDIYDYVDPPVFRGDTPREFAGHAPQELHWPPEGMTLIDAERIVDAINGMTITSATRNQDETIIQLQAPQAPSITLIITDDGYWTATVEN